MTSHIPKMVRYYGYYRNASRGQRKKAGVDAITLCLLQPETTDVQFRKTRLRLIQKTYEVEPLTCPKCEGKVRVIAFIEDSEVIKKILTSLPAGRSTWIYGISENRQDPLPTPRQ